MELCSGGDLFKVLKMAPYPLPVPFVAGIIEQVIKGLKEIHKSGLIHRDMKTENILVTSFPKTAE